MHGMEHVSNIASHAELRQRHKLTRLQIHNLVG